MDVLGGRRAALIRRWSEGVMDRLSVALKSERSTNLDALLSNEDLVLLPSESLYAVSIQLVKDAIKSGHRNNGLWEKAFKLWKFILCGNATNNSSTWHHFIISLGDMMKYFVTQPADFMLLVTHPSVHSLIWYPMKKVTNEPELVAFLCAFYKILSHPNILPSRNAALLSHFFAGTHQSSRTDDVRSMNINSSAHPLLWDNFKYVPMVISPVNELIAAIEDRYASVDDLLSILSIYRKIPTSQSSATTQSIFKQPMPMRVFYKLLAQNDLYEFSDHASSSSSSSSSSSLLWLENKYVRLFRLLTDPLMENSIHQYELIKSRWLIHPEQFDFWMRHTLLFHDMCRFFASPIIETTNSGKKFCVDDFALPLTTPKKYEPIKFAQASIWYSIFSFDYIPHDGHNCCVVGRDCGCVYYQILQHSRLIVSRAFDTQLAHLFPQVISNLIYQLLLKPSLSHKTKQHI
jgi:hypothetical protein